MSYEIARHWRLKAQRYNLVGQKWGDRYIFPPRLVPPEIKDEAELTVTSVDNDNLLEKSQGVETEIVLYESSEVI